MYKEVNRLFDVIQDIRSQVDSAINKLNVILLKSFLHEKEGVPLYFLDSIEIEEPFDIMCPKVRGFFNIVVKSDIPVIRCVFIRDSVCYDTAYQDFYKVIYTVCGYEFGTFHEAIVASKTGFDGNLEV